MFPPAHHSGRYSTRACEKRRPRAGGACPQRFASLCTPQVPLGLPPARAVCGLVAEGSILASGVCGQGSEGCAGAGGNPPGAAVTAKGLSSAARAHFCFFFLAATGQNFVKPPRSCFGLRVLGPLRHRERGDQPAPGPAAFPGRPHPGECLPHGRGAGGLGQVSKLAARAAPGGKESDSN